MKHKHRIIPGYERGEYSLDNVMELSITQHAMWHFAEWTRKKNLQDLVAYRMLSGQCNKEEGIALLLSEAGKKGGRYVRTDKTKEKLRQAQLGKKLSAETRAKMRASAKKAGREFQSQVFKRLANSPHKPSAGRKGMLCRWGYNGLFPMECEYQQALSDTFIDYYSAFGLKK